MKKLHILPAFAIGDLGERELKFLDDFIKTIKKGDTVLMNDVKLSNNDIWFITRVIDKIILKAKIYIVPNSSQNTLRLIAGFSDKIFFLDNELSFSEYLFNLYDYEDNTQDNRFITANEYRYSIKSLMKSKFHIMINSKSIESDMKTYIHTGNIAPQSKRDCDLIRGIYSIDEKGVVSFFENKHSLKYYLFTTEENMFYNKILGKLSYDELCLLATDENVKIYLDVLNETDIENCITDNISDTISEEDNEKFEDFLNNKLSPEAKKMFDSYAVKISENKNASFV